jgi:hypothetical protein
MIDLTFSCPQDITSMPKTSCGFFCIGCKKEVVDFRKFSDDEIQKYSKENKEKICGVFNSTQLVSPLKSDVLSIFRIAFAAIFILGINTTQLFAQDSIATAIINPIFSDSTFFIEGQIFDEDSISMPFAKVYVVTSDATFGCMTDFEGKYRLAVPGKYIGQSFKLCVSFITYSAHAIHFENFQKSYLTIPFNFYLKPNLKEPWVGIVVGSFPLLSMDPYEIGKTTITGEELRRMP